jgi:hypothetical protein
MRALLEQKLLRANLSFTEWTVLAFTSASPLNIEEVVQRLINGHVVTDASDAQKSIKNLVSASLITMNPGNVLTHSEKGITMFTHLNGEVEGITRTLFGDLPIADLETTHRTLLEIAKRANNLLARRNDA